MLLSFWRTTCPTCCAAYNCTNSSKNSPEKTLFTLSKNEYTSKAWIATLNAQMGTVLTLLCYFAQLKHRGCKTLWEHWLGLIQRLSYCNLDRGWSRTSLASRMKFFVTIVSDWESLAVVTKKSVLFPTGLLDPPLLEIEMSKLNKHHIGGREFY